jgi:glutathione S-transferase
MTPAGEAFAEAIDGQDGKTWSLPLPPLNATSTPEAYSLGEDPPRDRLEAAARLVSRGGGLAGGRPQQRSGAGDCRASGPRMLHATAAWVAAGAAAWLAGVHAPSSSMRCHTVSRAAPLEGHQYWV